MPIPIPDPIPPPPASPGHGWLHARISPEILEGALIWIKKLPRYIVAEEVGSETEKLHYHCAIEVPVGIEAIKKRFQTECKAKGLVSKKGQENAYYGGVKELTDISYVCKEGKFTATQGFTADELEHYRAVGAARYGKSKPMTDAETPIIAHMGPEQYHGPKFKQTKTSMRAKFKEYLETKKGYDCTTITIYNYAASRNELIDHLTEFWENAFTTPQGAVCIEFALWSFATDEVRDLIKEANRTAIIKCLR